MPIPVWRQIHDALQTEISEGRYPAGAKLPSEHALAQRFGVNRHTVRRAIAELQQAGLVHARRGAGVFVTGVQIAYRIGPGMRLTRNLATLGHQAGRTILRAETLKATAEEAKALSLKKGAAVHIIENVAAADAVPIAYSRTVFPAADLPGFTEAVKESGSITSALAACGVKDYRRQRTLLSAEQATEEQARHLRIAPGGLLLRTENWNVTPDGKPIEYGHVWFAADRVDLLVDDQSFQHP